MAHSGVILKTGTWDHYKASDFRLLKSRIYLLRRLILYFPLGGCGF